MTERMSSPPAPRTPSGDLAAFDLVEVQKSFGGQEVLRGITLRLAKGETLGIIGPSGAGKSVLLKCMVGLIPIDGGTLLFEGESVPGMTPDGLIRFRQQVGLLFQGAVLFDSMTVQENLEYALHEQFFRTMKRQEIRERVEWALGAVGLALSEASTMPKDLSGGMQKRVGIARTIITRPRVLLYDSPTEGLDPPNAHLISNLIAELRDRLGVTSVVVSHDLRTVFTVCSRVGYMEEGKLLETGPPGSLAESPNEAVRDFVIGHPPEEPLDPRESQPPEPWTS